jgi:hypothetical protein
MPRSAADHFDFTLLDNKEVDARFTRFKDEVTRLVTGVVYTLGLTITQMGEVAVGKAEAEPSPSPPETGDPSSAA